MQEYYVEYLFEDDNETVYLFPLFIQAINSKKAKQVFKVIQRELLENFTIIGLTPPKLNFNQLSKDYYEEKYRINITGNKLVKLDIHAYEFINYEPDISLSFNENLIQSIDEYGNTEKILTLIQNKRFPVRVLKTTVKQYTDYIVISIPNTALN